MPTIPRTLENVENIPAAHPNNRTLLFSKELATRLNPKRPDITGALILYGLYLLQKKPIESFGYMPMVNGKRGCYRSLSELQQLYPWLTRQAISKAIKRAERALKGAFVVDRDNPQAERGKLHFWLSPNLIKTYSFAELKRKGFLALQVDDAVQHGVIEAMLISNLEYVIDPEHNTSPLTDDAGRIYRELSALKLTQVQTDMNGDLKSILPCSRKAVSGAIGNLECKGGIIEHPRRSHFYTVNGSGNTVTKVDSRVTKVDRRNEVLSCMSQKERLLQTFSKTSYTNTSSKCLLETEPGSLRSPDPVANLSPEAKKLSDIVNTLRAARLRQPAAKTKLKKVGDEFCEGITFYNPDTDIEVEQQGNVATLAFEYVAKDPYTGKPYSRAAEINYLIADLKLIFRNKSIKYTSQDVQQLRKLLEDNPLLHGDELLELLHFLDPHLGIIGRCLAPKKGHDYYYWSRRIKTLKQFLHYLPQLIGEHHVCDSELKWDEAGKPIFDYSDMQEPYLSLAFRDDTMVPITHAPVTQRPIYYPEFAGLWNPEPSEHDSNPMVDLAA